MTAHRLERGGVVGNRRVRGNQLDYRDDNFVSPNNYEVTGSQELLKLDGERYVPGQGMSQSDVQSIPTSMHSGEEQECPICRDFIRAGQEVKVLVCSHRFHVSCIDAWLIRAARCPVDSLPLAPNSH